MGSCRARSVYLTTRLLGKRLTSIVHILSPEITCVEVVGFFLRLSHEKSVKSMFYLKIYIKVYLMHKMNCA